MSVVELKKHQCNCSLTGKDVYDARCGEVFITLSRKLIIHCSLCDNIYEIFGTFLKHLLTHYENIENKSIKANTEGYKIEIDAPYLPDIYIPNALDHLVNFDIVKCNRLSDNNTIVLDTSEEEVSAEGVIKTELTNRSAHLETIESAVLNEVLCDYDKLHSEEEDTSFTKIKYHHCVQCKKLFNNRKHLSRHYLTHSDERKHKCSICGAAFKEKSNFNAHIRRHSGNKKIECDLCSKKFYTRTEKVLHMRSHTHEKPYICSHCGISFTTSSALSTHTKRHTAEPDFKCKYCNKGCWRKEELEDHILVHTREKRFTCSACNAKYPRRKSLLRHLKIHGKF